ncbi:uncharacterized protein LOC134766632 [Penaeus indicus]|uniref:uncharacterized protein LOC134766632 n=1 Tax=Penaeus indicus TaxID=29960 RepID=UPI00300C778E
MNGRLMYGLVSRKSLAKNTIMGADQLNSYVTLKLQNVKSTTVCVKGPQPCWEQDFLFETNRLDTGMLVEVWNKGLIWDKALGYHWIPLTNIQYSNEEGEGRWYQLDAERVLEDGEVTGTRDPTGDSILLDCRFELPWELEETEAQELQRKLEVLNHLMDQETRGALGPSRTPQQTLMSRMSEDSDYTSDINYPVGQHPNSSASQFLSVANQMSTPQRSLETSRENSYEREDSVQYGVDGVLDSYGPASDRGYYDDTYENNKRNEGRSHTGGFEDDLYYNSRPNNRKDYSPVSSYFSTHEYISQYANQEDFDKAPVTTTTTTTTTTSSNARGKLTRGTTRRPSLERQITLYDEQGGGTSGDVTSRENRYSNYHSYYHQYSTSQEEPSSAVPGDEVEQTNERYENEQGVWYDKDRTEGYYGEYGKEYSKDEGYQNDKTDDGYAGEQYDEYGYDQYGQYYDYYGYDKNAENYDYSQYGYYGYEGWENYYQNYDGYYGYYDEAGVFHNYNENYNYAYRSNEHLDTPEEVQGDSYKGGSLDAYKMITAYTTTATTTAITTTTAISPAMTFTTSTTTKPLGNHVAPAQKPQPKADGGLFNKLLPQLPISLSSTTTTAAATTTTTTTTITTTQSSRPLQQPTIPQARPVTAQQAAQQHTTVQQKQQQQQQQKPAAGGFGLFGGMNKKGGLFNAMSGITSKMSDTLNTAVKEVSAVAQHANVAAQQTTKAATAKAAAAAKSAGVVPPAAAQKAPTPPTAQPKPSAPMTPRTTLTKQESVRSDKMPGDEAERRSLATLPEVSDPEYQSDSLKQQQLWHQDSFETAHTDRTQPRQDSYETAPEDSIYDEEIEPHPHDAEYDDYYSRHPGEYQDSYYGDYYDDDPHYRYRDDFEDSFDNDDVSSIVDTDRNLPRYSSQGSQERFIDGDGQYSTEYDSGTDSREVVNARIEPYPGDLSKVLSDTPHAGPTLPEQAPGAPKITGTGPADAAAVAAADAEGPRDDSLTPQISNEVRHVSFEGDDGAPEDEAPKKKMTARERWYWAFDKIVDQLNQNRGGLDGVVSKLMPGDNPFYSNIDSMPDIRPRRKSIPLVSELVGV